MNEIAYVLAFGVLFLLTVFGYWGYVVCRCLDRIADVLEGRNR